MNSAATLLPAIVYLSAGLIAAFASRALRISPIVGYLAAGLIIGPFGLKLVADNETTHFLAELGVAFMLFDIGLHFSLKEIQTRRSDIFLLAPLQLALCGLTFALINLAFGYRPEVGLIVGASIALSSTAVVGKILADRNQPSCPIGRSATAVLVAQDIAAIFILAFAASISATAEEAGVQMALALAWALGFLGLAIVAGRFGVRPLFSQLARTHNEEAFTVVALLIVLAASLATASAGLSLTLGAFLAGMAMSETPYRHVVQNEIKPFQGLLLGLFFISAGMQVNIPAVSAIWPTVVLVAVGILVLKTALVFIAAKAARWATPGATQLAFLLSQGSEFTLVVLGIPAVSAAMPAGWAGVLLGATAITLVAAAPWSAAGQHLARILAVRAKADPAPEPEVDAGAPVIIFGMTAEARLAADALRDHDIPYIGVDADPERFVTAASDGYNVVYGDARDLSLMRSLMVYEARAIVLGTPQLAILEILRAHPEGEALPAKFVAANDNADRARWNALGLRAHVAMGEPRGVELVADLLDHLGVERGRVSAWIGDLAERLGLTNGRLGEEAGAVESA